MNPDFSHRTTLLIGEQGSRVLAASRVAVFGVGGVGSFAAEALARSGVGTLILTDFDTVRPSNINRQIPATIDTIGALKVDAMAARLRTINPDMTILSRPVRFCQSEADTLLSTGCDFVVDAIDSLSAKVNLIHECVSREIPIISSMGSASKIRSELVRVGDLFDSAGCPLAKMVRKRLRRRGVTRGVPVVYSEELPILSGRSAGIAGDIGDHDTEGQGVHGTLSYMPGLFGLHCAGFVIQRLLAEISFTRRGDTVGKS
ncbi:MAG: tRNA threonylcarbamoyladenosine dehydratase [Lentisphaeria bacterium]|nr:tRNA threonylcarbamoyladenosine dehydratase [Lentisphaeria bacterium]